jgi:predicted dehydrogenase
MDPNPPKKRIACVGMGQRFEWFYRLILTELYRETWDIVALCDINPGRLQMNAERINALGYRAKTYAHTQFDQLVAETRPEVVLVTSKDCTHDFYICRAMELGCDVITEKPMTMHEEKCQRILDTQKRTGRKCRVTFNYRYSPPRTQIKHLLLSGVVGEIRSVDFHWLLDTRHGADYFRRWHRQRANSGGLQVHKATHHFDLVNWWLSSVPETVYATGARNFYTPHTAARYGLANPARRCLDCSEHLQCPFFVDFRDYPDLVATFLNHENHDGYLRDACVFSPEIDIEDTLHAVVQYRSGVSMSYSLHAFSPWEGYIIAFTGSRGRLEHVCQETVYFSGDGSTPGELIPEGTTIKIYPHFKPGYSIEVWSSEGGHGGGDPRLAEDLFSETPPADPYLRAADQRAGAWSILTGVAANRSMEWGRPVRVDELVRGLDEPEYPPMPVEAETLAKR